MAIREGVSGPRRRPEAVVPGGRPGDGGEDGRDRPDAVGVERLFFNKNVQTAFAVGQARGVVLLAAAQHGLPVYEYGPNEVKIAVTGYGRAPKAQVQRMVQAILGLTELPRPDDAADALAVAVCLAHGYRPAA